MRSMNNSKSAPTALGTESIWKLLLQFAIPSVIAMTASSLYNIIDSIFIGQGVGPLAISGLAISFPLMNLSAAFGSLVGAGGAALMSLRLGQKDYSSANLILGNAFTLNVVIGTIYAIVVLIFLDPILYFFGASDATIPYARDYMEIISLGNVITHLYFGQNALLRASGFPAKSMYATIGSVLINIILAPIFIYVFDWGIRGAALATIIAQASMLAWQMLIFCDKSNFIHFHKGVFKLRKKIVKDSLSIGLAPFLMNSVSCVVVIVINQGLIRYGGDLQVGAYGIINRISALFAMIVAGLNMGMQPVAGYNYGARQLARVNKVLKLTILLATSVMSVGFIIGEFFPRAVASLFTKDEGLISLVVPGMRIVLIFFPIVGFQMVASNFFQSIGKPGKAIFMSLSRQVVFLLPALFILPNIFGVKGVWYSIPLADLLASMITAYLLFHQLKKSKLSL
jgi:putative MATE family efflux protein